eukprot:jgi/Tetstr1/456322/TSEL_004102.t1
MAEGGRAGGGLKQAGLSRFFAKVPKPAAPPAEIETAKEGGKGGGAEQPVAAAETTEVVAPSKQPAQAGTKRRLSPAGGRAVPAVQPAAPEANKKLRSSGEAQAPELAASAPLSEDAGEAVVPTSVTPQQPNPTGPPAATAAPEVAPRDAQRHSALQRKLVDNGVPRGGGGRVEGKTAGGGKNHPAPGAKLTPLEQQVVELKRKHPGVLLVVEVGYKMRFFGDDAETASAVCNIMSFPDHNFLTASIPVQRLHVHVGVVRQMESAALKAAGSNRSAPFVRQLTALYTPATLDAGDVETGGLDSTGSQGDVAAGGASSQLVLVLEKAMTPSAADVVVMAVDCSSGTLQSGVLREGPMRAGLEAALLRLRPAEVLLPASGLSPATQKLLAAWTASGGVRVEHFQRDKYANGGGRTAVATALAEHSASDAAMELSDLEAEGLAHLFDYLKGLSMERVLAQAGCFRPLHEQAEMQLTPNTLTHLEVLGNSDDGAYHGSLLWLLSQTLTAGGGRVLRRWVSRPLTRLPDITRRLDAVGALRGAVGVQGGDPMLAGLPAILKGLPDLEAGVTRMLHRTASPAEAVRVLRAFTGLPESLGLASRAERLMAAGGGAAGRLAGVGPALLRELLAAAADDGVEGAAAELLGQMNQHAAEADDLIALMTSAERFPEVFECHAEVAGAEAALQAVLKDLRTATRRPSLNYVEIANQARRHRGGTRGKYLIEVPADSAVPAGWAKVCSTKKVDRYHPPAVKEGIHALEMAAERRHQACKAAWLQLLDDFAMHYSQFRSAAAALSELDALLSLSQVSSAPGFCRPSFVGEDAAPRVRIRGGRHPMMDALLPGGCVPNDTALSGGGDGQSALLVTGPNMGGKSCYIRQTALIVLMAQIGCYVPADSAELHVVDCIYTRMGASDNIAAGRSTFQVELTEASFILANATPRSLVIIDELGRGTSTHDGVAIASATLEHLLAAQRCLTLFVTHYPQLGALAAAFPGRMGAYHMAYAAAGEGGAGAPRIAFLYKLAPGVVESSFGMNVAALAGLPPAVVGGARLAAMAAEVLRAAGGGAAARPLGELRAEAARLLGLGAPEQA